MCLTGVDYFSTLGYIPSIAYEATGNLAPIAMVLLVLATLFGALPIYAYVASRSPKGMGSIAMLERLVRGWTGKLLVLSLLGFAGTAFIVTKTLSAADAAEHLIHNPLIKSAPEQLRSRVMITMVLLVVLGAMFLRGFREVIGVAVIIVAVYLVLNIIVIGSGLIYLANNPAKITEWWQHVHNSEWIYRWNVGAKQYEWGILDHPFGNSLVGPSLIVLVCLLYFPRLALGLSGFETGLMVMPLIKGDPEDTEENPRGRIRNTRKLLITAAVIMSIFLLTSTVVVSTLIPPKALVQIEDQDPPQPHVAKKKQAGAAANRALAFIAHGEGNSRDINGMFGDVFGTVYDLSTIVILWFAGASAMAGLLNLVPQYLPRYGMAPEWARAVRPLIILFTVINLIVTWLFDASVEEQSGAYATGVLVFLASGCLATLIDRYQFLKRKGESTPIAEDATIPRGFFRPMALVIRSIVRIPWFFGLVTLLFLYATVAMIFNKPDGIVIAALFVIAILICSFISRMMRSKEIRFQGFEFANEQSEFLWNSIRHLEFPVLVPHRPGRRDLEEKEASIRKDHRLTDDIPIVFAQVELEDVSEFYFKPLLEVIEEDERFVLKITRCASIAHVIAATALELSRAGESVPEVHFGWSEESPFSRSLSFVLFGEGNVPWMVRELIHRAEPDPKKCPRVVIG